MIKMTMMMGRLKYPLKYLNVNSNSQNHIDQSKRNFSQLVLNTYIKKSITKKIYRNVDEDKNLNSPIGVEVGVENSKLTKNNKSLYPSPLDKTQTLGNSKVDNTFNKKEELKTEFEKAKEDLKALVKFLFNIGGFQQRI